jgi:putative transposase
MTAELNPNDRPAVSEQLQQAEPDVLRSMLTVFVQALMSADVDAACGAEFGTRSAERVNRRNGYRSREWDTRAGAIELAIPKLREGPTSRTGCWSAANAPSGP